MAVTSWMFGMGLRSLAMRRIDWINDPIRAVLTTATYVPDEDTHEFVSQVTNQLLATDVTGRSLTYDAATQRVLMRCTDVTFAGATFTAARHLVLYRDDADPAAAPLVGWVDLGGDVSAAAQDYTVGLSGGPFHLALA